MRKGVGLKVGVMVVAAVALLGGCSDVRTQTLWNPSPAEMGPVTTAEQVNNGISQNSDTNLRLFWDDLGRFWLMDRPSRMTPYPVK